MLVNEAACAKPLHIASEEGHVGIMRILLDVGRVDIDGLTECSSTGMALHVAAYNGRREAAALLIERGAEVNLVSGFLSETPLDTAYQAWQNSTNIVALLKSKGAKRASELPEPST